MLGLKRGEVVLYDHQSEWEEEAAATIKKLKEIFGDTAIDIQHVGSTAIRHIKAKPVIDIAVGVREFNDVLALSPALEEQGFICVGWENNGEIHPMYQCGEFVFGEKLPRVLTHFIHIVIADSEQWHDYINHRDYMNAIPSAADEYESLKIHLADENSDNYNNYFLGKQVFIRETVKFARLWNDLGREFIKIEPIIKGWSCDKKYCITTRDGTKYLLRVTPHDKSATRKALFDILRQVEMLGIPMCKPVEYGVCEDGVYALHTWIDGEDAEEVIPLLSETEQYVMGLKAGDILKKIHSIPAPKEQEDWVVRFNRKTSIKLQKYRECGLRFDGGDKVIEYIENNRHLLENRPQCFQHGDYHIGNMMTQKGELVIIDFDRFDFGDPWEEFNRIVWCAQNSPHFATGMVKGYFDGEPPMLFWQLLAFYIGSNTLSSIYWAIPFGQSDIDEIMKQSRNILAWYDNMQNVVPTWYLPNFCKFM